MTTLSKKQLDEILRRPGYEVAEEKKRRIHPSLLPGERPKKKRKHKYSAEKTTVDGITFDSKAEARRYIVLKMLQKQGHISDLSLQPKFTLQEPFTDGMGNKQRGIYYQADFMYKEVVAGETAVVVEAEEKDVFKAVSRVFVQADVIKCQPRLTLWQQKGEKRKCRVSPFFVVKTAVSKLRQLDVYFPF